MVLHQTSDSGALGHPLALAAERWQDSNDKRASAGNGIPPDAWMKGPSGRARWRELFSQIDSGFNDENPPDLGGAKSTEAEHGMRCIGLFKRSNFLRR
jgi:hypothetical protein